MVGCQLRLIFTAWVSFIRIASSLLVSIAKIMLCYRLPAFKSWCGIIITENINTILMPYCKKWHSISPKVTDSWVDAYFICTKTLLYIYTRIISDISVTLEGCARTQEQRHLRLDEEKKEGSLLVTKSNKKQRTQDGSDQKPTNGKVLSQRYTLHYRSTDKCRRETGEYIWVGWWDNWRVQVSRRSAIRVNTHTHTESETNKTLQ